MAWFKKSLQFAGNLKELEFKHLNYAELITNKGAVFKLIAENPKATDLLHTLKANIKFEMIFYGVKQK